MKERILLVVFALLLYISKLYCQVPPPPEFEEHGPGPGTRPTPIDEPIIYLVMMGMTVGIIYFLKKRKSLAK